MRIPLNTAIAHNPAHFNNQLGPCPVKDYISTTKDYRVSQEIKEEILSKIKNDGLSVADAAANYGIHTGTIYNWLGTKAKGVVSILEHNKLKKENAQLITYLKHRGKWLYVATVLDVFTREIVGVSILNTHTTQLVMNALSSAVLHRAPPRIIHSDQGSEYTSMDYTLL